MQGKRQTGFTLLELMIVVVIIAVLAALAIYNYNKYGFRARRSDGKEMIARVAAAEERYYTNFNQYTTDMTQLKFNTDPTISTNGYYAVSGANGSSGDTQTYKLKATPQLGQVGDACGDLMLDNSNGQTFSGTATNGPCW